MLRALDGRYAFDAAGDGTPGRLHLRVDLAVPMPGLVKRRASGMIMGNALRDLKRDGGERSSSRATEPIVASRTRPTSRTPRDRRSTASRYPEPTPSPTTRRRHADDRGTDRRPGPHPDAVAFDDAGTEERPLPPPSILESVITELLGAVPEVRDHVLQAADALLDAAKALIDAADRVVRQQRGDE